VLTQKPLFDEMEPKVCKKETTSETLGFTGFFVVVCFSMLP